MLYTELIEYTGEIVIYDLNRSKILDEGAKTVNINAAKFVHSLKAERESLCSNRFLLVREYDIMIIYNLKGSIFSHIVLIFLYSDW